MKTRPCDCVASGNLNKPKQHGADPHAKNCAIYISEPVYFKGVRMPFPETSDDVPVLDFTSPESSTIASANYDPDTHTVFIHFKNGKTYRGNDFPPKAWDEFVQARSKGAHFNQRIRPLYLMKKQD